MQPEISQTGETTNLDSNISKESGTLAKLPPAEEPSPQQLRRAGRGIAEQVILLLNRVGETFGEYKPAVIAIGLILAAMPLLAFLVALLTVINIIPLLSPTLKLIGFGFTTWFVYRYLLFAPNRQELSQELQTLKGQVLGSDDQPQDQETTDPQAVKTQSQNSPEQTPESDSFPEPDPESPEPNSKPAPEPDPETPSSEPE